MRLKQNLLLLLEENKDIIDLVDEGTLNLIQSDPDFAKNYLIDNGFDPEFEREKGIKGLKQLRTLRAAEEKEAKDEWGNNYKEQKNKGKKD